ncbi:MAG: class I SAM-dependent methyltransferase [Acidimicrobiales bacterium]
MAASQREQVRLLFDRVALDYDAVDFFKPLGRSLVSWAGVPPGSQVLDLGAGRGAVTKPLADAVGPRGSLAAVDISHAMISALRQDMASGAALIYLQVDAGSLPFRPAGLDFVLAGFVIHILADPEETLEEIVRVLRPGGHLVFSVPAPSSNQTIQPYVDVIEEFAERASPEQWSMQPPPDLLALLKKVGFVDVEESLVEVSVPMADPDAFLKVEMSHGFRGWVDALSHEDRTAFMMRATEALRVVAATGELRMDRAARLIRATRALLV